METFDKEQLFRFGDYIKKHPELSVNEAYIKWKSKTIKNGKPDRNQL